MLRHTLRSFLAAAVLAGFAHPVAAQEAHHPQISVVHKGLKQLKADIELLLDLATDDDRHKENWIGVIELFAIGLDEERPFRIDILSGLTPAPVMIYGPFVDPVSDLLNDNLEGAEYVPQKVTDTLYELLPPDRGWFRILPQEKYAILTLSEKSNHSLLKQLILKAGSPAPVIAEIMLKGVNIGAQLKNDAVKPEDQQKRKASFQEIRTNQMDALQKRPQESKTEFELRKGILSVYQDEVERVVVEALRAALLISLNPAPAEAPTAQVKIDWVGIPESSLAGIAAAVGKEKDAFASVKSAEDSALSVRINHPIDELRQKNADTIMGLIKADVLSHVNASDSNMTAEQKEATEQLVDGIITLIRDSNATGNLNAFMESVPRDEGKFTSWGAAVAKDAKRLDETLALIAKTGENNKVDLKVESVNGFDIHRISLEKGFLKAFDDVFGENAVVYIATSETMVWFSTGPESLESLKSAVTDLGDPADSGVILKVKAHLLPWAKRAEDLAKKLPKPEGVDQEESRRNLLLTLKQATEALKAEDDDIEFNMALTDDGVATNVLDIGTGLLRFIGTQLEKFSKENLE